MENCYFWTDETQAEEETINVLCVKCHDEQYSTLGWFWDGERLGYGPFDFICNKCGHIIQTTKKVEE